MEYDVVKMLLEGKKSKGVSKEEAGFYQQTQARLAYHSGYLDGIRLIRAQVDCICDNGSVNLLGNEMVTLDDIQETKNHFVCMDYILEHIEDEVTEDFIKECHVIMKKDTRSGQREDVREYRRKNLMNGTTPAVEPKQIESEMQKLLAAYGELEETYIENVFALHCGLIRISPFNNANGRIARLILFKECLKYKITPIIIEDMQKAEYYHALRSGETNFDACMDLCFQCQDTYRELVKLYVKKKQ